MAPSAQRPDRALIAIAAPREVDAVVRGFRGVNRVDCPLWEAVPISERFDLVRTGVGPAAAAGGMARAIDPARHGSVLSLGIAGVLPGELSLKIGDVVLATRSLFADLGLGHPEGFTSIGEMGFATTGSGDVFAPDAALAERLAPLADARGPVATVSTCSGTDALASTVRGRVGEAPAAEAMEGAGVGLVAAMLGVPFAEMRVISNTTGDRSSQQWSLDAALDRLSLLARSIADLDLTPTR